MPDTVRIGKAVIACLMGDAIRTPSAGDEEDKWFGEIFAQMREGCATYAAFVKSNTVRFVTFNFDSLIEDKLADRVRGTFNDAPSGDLETELAKAIPVIHVHGRLPEPPKLPICPLSGTASQDWIDWLQRAAPVVNVISDSLQGDALADARAAIDEAAIVCFLGFAYEQTNLQRLDVKETIRENKPDDPKHQWVFGSAFKIAPSRRFVIERRLKERIQLGNQNEKCRTFLENTPGLFRD